jgi:PAS domain S-box-containing protein
LIGLQLRLPPFGISIIWPPNAILLAALMLVPVRMWWCYLLALLPAHLNLVTYFQVPDVPIPTMFAQFAGNTLQAVIAAFAVRPLVGVPPRLDTLRQMAGFIVLAAIAAPALASLLAVGLFLFAGWVDDFWLAWRMRFLTNVFATLTFTPLIILTAAEGRIKLRDVPVRICAEYCLLAVGLFAVGIPIFGMEAAGPGSYPALLYAPLPLLLWAASRFGLRPLAVALLVIALLSLGNAVAGRGPFATSSPEENVTQLQLYLVAISFPLIFLTTVLQERRRAVAALQLSEAEARTQYAQLSAIYRAAPTGLAFIDTQLRYVSVNDHLAEINRLPAAAHIGRTLREVLGNLADEIEPLYRRVIATGQPIVDIEVNRREAIGPGAGRVWLVSYHPVKNEQEIVLGVSAVVQEITARKRAEEALRNIAAGVSATTGEPFFRSLAEHISRALQVEYAFVCERADNKSRARTIVSYVNGAGVENIEYDLADTPCEQVLKYGMYVCPEGVKKAFPCDVPLQEMDVEGYLGVCLKDSVGHPLGYMSVMSRKPMVNVETTQAMLSIFAVRAAAELERRQAELELRMSEERYREVVESQTDLVCRYLADGTLTFANEAYCRFFGYPRDKMIGRKFTEFIPENARASAMEFVARLNKERRPLEVEHEVIQPNGNLAWQHWVDYAILDTEGRVIEFQAIGRDITDRKRAEEANQKLAHASRLAMVGELAAIIAHDLSQPLSALLSNAASAELILRKSKPLAVKDLREIVADIRDDSMRATASIRRMRTLLRKQRLELQPLNLNELVADAVHMVSSEALRRRVHITTECETELPLVKGDRVHLLQVVLNLILNGMDAMDNTPESERRLQIRLGTDGNGTVETAISDAGQGIPHDRVPRIFESFYTTKKDGMGLGLSIAKSIIEAHLGHIWAENNATRGATFRFTLPADRETALSSRIEEFIGSPS